MRGTEEAPAQRRQVRHLPRVVGVEHALSDTHTDTLSLVCIGFAFAFGIDERVSNAISNTVSICVSVVLVEPRGKPLARQVPQRAHDVFQVEPKAHTVEHGPHQLADAEGLTRASRFLHLEKTCR